MNSKYFINGNKKSTKTENNYKIKSLNRKNSHGKIYFTKRMPFYKYLLNKKLKIKLSDNKKTSSTEKKTISYRKNDKISLLNLNNSYESEKKSKYSHNTKNIQNQELDEKEKVILELLRLKDDINEKNQELNLLKNYYNKLQDNNLTYQIIIEKILTMKEGNNDKTKENNDLKNAKISLNKKKIKMLKLQIVGYDKKIEDQKIILNEAKKEKKVTNFINVNKLINNKNKELEKLVLESQKIQHVHINMDNRVDFYNYSIKKYKDSNFGLKIKIEINKKEKKLKDEKIEMIKKEIKETEEKLDNLEKELELIEQNNIDKKDELKNLKNEYEKNIDLKKEKIKYENEINNYNSLDNKNKIIFEKNERKIKEIKNNNINIEKKIYILKEEIKKLKEKEKIKEINKKIIEKKIKEIKEEIEKNKNEENLRKVKVREEKEKIQKEIKEFEKAKISLINKIKELNKELEEKTKESSRKEHELEKTNHEYNIIINNKK